MDKLRNLLSTVKPVASDPPPSESIKICTTEDLPDYILIYIFTFLKHEYLASTVRHVCRRWRGLADYEDLWHSFTLMPKSMSDRKIIRRLKNMPSLKSFIYYNSRNDADEILLTLTKHCPLLRTLEIPNLKISPQVSKALKELKHLIEIGISVEDIKVLADMKNLSSLNLVRKDGLDTCVQNMQSGRHPNDTNAKCDPKELNKVLNLKKDKIKKFVWEGQMHSSTLSVIAQFSRLIALQLSKFTLEDTDENFGNIPIMPDINSLKYVVFEESSLQLLTHILYSTFDHVLSLQLSAVKGNIDVSLKIILNSCVSLQELLLENITFSCSTLLSIGCVDLMCLGIYNCKYWGSDFIRVLRLRCKKLKVFFIGHCNPSIEMYREISKLYSLEDLSFRSCDLRNCDFTDLVEGLPSLEIFYMKDCVVTPQPRKLLKFWKKERPEMKITILD